MKKNNQNNLKHLKETLKSFIVKYITKNSNMVVKSAKLHHYFSILNDITISSHSFFPLFLNTYHELFGEKLTTKAIRLKKGEPFVRCVLKIQVDLVSDHILHSMLNNTVSINENTNNTMIDIMIQKNLLETKEEPKIKTKNYEKNIL